MRLVLLGQKLLDNLAAKPGILPAHRGPRGTPDRGARLAGDGETFPGSRRHLRIGADDVDLVAILEFGHQRRMAAIDPAADAAVADGGVHGIGEIDRRCAFRQGDELALRREAEHLVVEQFELGVFEKFLGALAFRQHFDEMAQPAIGVGFRGRQREIRPALPAHRARPCKARAPPRRARQFHASAGCGSAFQRACDAGRSRSCAASGNHSAWASRCSP